MNGYETRRAADQEQRYQRSEAGRLALEADKQRRAVIDRKLGHVAGCSLTRCAEGCRSDVAGISLAASIELR